jgi:transketolase
MLEDIALMRVIPNMVVLDPIDVIETKKMVLEAAKNEKPTYIRVQRDPTPVITSEGSPFKIGRAEVLWETKSPEVAIIGCGPILYEALLAARDLGRKGIDSLVINSHTLKPLDDQAIIHAAKITGAIVSVEEHQKAGGLGGAVAEVLARNFPVPMEFIGMPDKFGESGKPKELLEKYGMKAQDIESAVKRVIKKKNT